DILEHPFDDVPPIPGADVNAKRRAEAVPRLLYLARLDDADAVVIEAAELVRVNWSWRTYRRTDTGEEWKENGPALWYESRADAVLGLIKGLAMALGLLPCDDTLALRRRARGLVNACDLYEQLTA